ncbi:MAG: BrnT family toxin [Magnetococcales bacterium]|nr:BrnT family toxin [Magnetococcales bacterium]
MNIEWDEDKRLTNLRKHRIDFRDAGEVLSGPTMIIEDNGPYDEQRFLTLGLLRGHVVVVAHTERDDRTRIISMRKAVKHEREAYFSQF